MQSVWHPSFVAVVLCFSFTSSCRRQEASRPIENPSRSSNIAGDSGKELFPVLLRQGYVMLFEHNIGDLAARSDSRPSIVPLVEQAEEEFRECLTSEWLPGEAHSFLKAIRRGDSLPDLLVSRYDAVGGKVELTATERAVFVSIMPVEFKPISTGEGAVAAFFMWRKRVFGLDMGSLDGKVKVETESGCWFVRSSVVEPYTWPESLRAALAADGRWLSMALTRGLRKDFGGPHPGWSYRIAGGPSWFDAAATRWEQEQKQDEK